MIAGIAGALATSGVALFWLPAAQLPPEAVTVRLEVLTDTLTPAGGIAVRIKGAQDQATQFLTSATGSTAAVDAAELDTLDVAFRETVLSDGIALGQRFALPVPVFDNYAWAAPSVGTLPCALWVSRTVPIGVPVVLSGGGGADTEVWAEGRTALWSIQCPGEGSGYRFQAFVAPLGSGTAVASSASYHGVDFEPDRYLAGLAIGSSGAFLGVDTTSTWSGFVATLDLNPLGHGQLTDLTLDAYHFRTAPPVLPPPGEPSIQAQPLEVDLVGLDAGYAGVHVSGHLPAGWLMLALRPTDGVPGKLVVMTSNPPPFEGASSAGLFSMGGSLSPRTTAMASVVSAPPSHSASRHWFPPSGVAVRDVALVGLPLKAFLAEDCTPVPAGPPSDWSCAPPATSKLGCPPPVMGPVECSDNTSPTSDIFCGEPGDQTGERKAHAKSWTTAIRTTIPGTAVGSESSHTFESTTESFNSKTFQSGAHGLGQCYQTFLLRTYCYASAIEIRHGLKWVKDHGGGWYREVVACADERTVLSVCSQNWHLQESCSRTP